MSERKPRNPLWSRTSDWRRRRIPILRDPERPKMFLFFFSTKSGLSSLSLFVAFQLSTTNPIHGFEDQSSSSHHMFQILNCTPVGGNTVKLDVAANMTTLDIRCTASGNVSECTLSHGLGEDHKCRYLEGEEGKISKYTFIFGKQRMFLMAGKIWQERWRFYRKLEQSCSNTEAVDTRRLSFSWRKQTGRLEMHLKVKA